MSKIILFNLITLDGYFAGPDGDINWHNVDGEFNDFAIRQLDTAAGLIFGRVTYQLMAGYWPTRMAIDDDPIVAGKMNALPKIVFSRTLDKAEWNNTRLVKRNTMEEVQQLRRQPGKDWFVFGSGDLAASLTQNGLIDEYRLMVNPIVLGNGIPMFKDRETRLKLKLIDSRAFQSGNVLLTYAATSNEDRR